MKSENNSTKKQSSFSAKQKIIAFGTAAFLAYAAPAFAQEQKKSEPMKKQKQVVHKVMPGLQFKVYDIQGKTLEDWTKLTEKDVLFPPFIVPYGGSFELQYQNGTIVHENIELDVLVSDLQGNYLKNYKRLANRGERAFPPKINTIEAGMKSDTFYAVYASKEKAGSLDLIELGPNPSKEILASVLALVYVQGKCPPPTVETKTVEKEVFRTLPPALVAVPAPIAEPSKEEKGRETSLSAGAFYTGDKRWGAQLSLDQRVAKSLALGLGLGFAPPTKREITTNVQRNTYNVEDLKLLGETNLETQRDSEIYALFLEALFGKRGKVNVAIKGGPCWNRNNFSYQLVQTVKNADTGKLLDQFACKAGSDRLIKIGYFAEMDFDIPLSNDLHFYFGGGIFGNQPTGIIATYNNGSTQIPVKLGKITTWEASMGVRFKL